MNKLEENFNKCEGKNEEDKSPNCNSTSDKETMNFNYYRRVKNSIEVNNKKIFSNLTFFVEIFMGETEISECIIKILESQGATISKRVKGSDFIIFNEGKRKTIEKALKYDIKLVSPTWIHESTVNSKIMNVENYLIKKTFSDLFLENIKKRKFNEISKGAYKVTPKKRKTTAKNVDDYEMDNTSTQTETNEYFKKIINKDLINKHEENKEEKEFKKEEDKDNIESQVKEKKSKIKNNRDKSKKKRDTQSEKVIHFNVEKDLKTITCIDSTIFETQKINKICKEMGRFKFQEFSIENINTITYFFVKKETNMKSEIKKIYILLSKEIDLFDINYLYDSLKSKDYLEISKYKIDKAFYLQDLNKIQKDDKILNKYKIFFHESFKNSSEKEENTILLVTLCNMCILIGGKIVDNIRLSDICILNKKENEYFPPHIKLLNQEFLIDSFKYMKLPDFNEKKYLPSSTQKKKVKNNNVKVINYD